MKPVFFSPAAHSKLFTLFTFLAFNFSAFASGARLVEGLIGDNPTVEHIQSSKRKVDSQADSKALAVRAWMKENDLTLKKIKLTGEKDGNRFLIRALDKGISQRTTWSKTIYEKSLKAIPADRDKIIEELDALEQAIQAYETRKQEIDTLPLTENEKDNLLYDLKRDVDLARQTFVSRSSNAGFLLGDTHEQYDNLGIYNQLLSVDPKTLIVDISDIFNIRRIGSSDCLHFVRSDIGSVDLASIRDLEIVKHLAYHRNTLSIRCSSTLTQSSAKYDARSNTLTVSPKVNTRIGIRKMLDGPNSQGISKSMMENAIRKAFDR